MNKINPLVSIIMNCHNGERYLEESLKSILFQTYENWELVFFDNNSNDNSKKILFSFNDKRIKYLYSKKFLKLYDARNKAINKAHGDYITFLDTDDLWLKDKLEKQINFFQNNQNYKVIYSNYLVLKQNDNFKYKKYIKVLPSGKIVQNLFNEYVIGILTVALDKKIFNHEQFNKEYDIIGDFDFLVKLSQNYEIGCIQEPLSIYRSHDQSFSQKKETLYVSEMEHWIKENKKKFSPKINFLNLKIFIIKLKLKIILNKIKNLIFK